MLPEEELAIYQIECLRTGKKYFGETQNIRQLFRNTYNTLQQGNHPLNSFQTIGIILDLKILFLQFFI